jgi:hypothetical protein
MTPFEARMAALMDALEHAETRAEKQLVIDQMAETMVTMLRPVREPQERNWYERED